MKIVAEGGSDFKKSIVAARLGVVRSNCEDSMVELSTKAELPIAVHHQDR